MKEYRQSSHTYSLLVWALLCTVVAVVLFVHSRKIVDRVLKTEEIAIGVALLMFGPIAFALYLIRARHVWVAVEAEGIRVSGRHLIPWSGIDRVERRRPRLRKKSGPAEIPSLKETDPSGCVGCGDLGGCALGAGEVAAVIGILVAALFAIWVLFFVLIPLLLVPLLEIFAPFGDRIRIVAGGHALVLRDLHDADAFIRQVAEKIRVVES